MSGVVASVRSFPSATTLTFGLFFIAAHADAAPHHAMPCAVQGEHVRLEDLVVRAGDQSFTVFAEDVAATAHPELGAASPLQIETAIVFNATPKGSIPYVTKAPIVAPPVQLGVGARLSHVRTERHDLIVDLKAGATVLHDLALPCGAVGLEGPKRALAEDTLFDPWALTSTSDPQVFPIQPSYWLLYAEPGDASPIRLEGALETRRVSLTPDRGDWMHVVAHAPFVTLDGWVRRRAFTVVHGGDRGEGIGLGRIGTCSHSSFERAQVRAGARVRFAPHGAVWGTVPRAAIVGVGPASGGWVPIRRVDGFGDVCHGFQRAWVRATDITL